MLDLRFCARAFSSCGERGPLFIAVRGPLSIAASLVAEHRLQTRRLSSCGSQAQLLRGMWYLPRPGLEPVSPASAGRFSTTAPPGKPPAAFLMDSLFLIFVFALQSVWEERNICISAPSVGTLFQGFKPPYPYFSSLVIQTDIGIAWVAMDSTKLYLSSESKNNFVCQCTSLLFNCSLSVAGGEKAGGWMH